MECRFPWASQLEMRQLFLDLDKADALDPSSEDFKSLAKKLRLNFDHDKRNTLDAKANYFLADGEKSVAIENEKLRASINKDIFKNDILKNLYLFLAEKSDNE